MEPSNGDEEYEDTGLRYRRLEDISEHEIVDALRSLTLLGDDPYLGMLAYNLAAIDQFIMRLEDDVLKKLVDEERTPAPEAMFLSAQSQMWIFAAYELLRTWRERARATIKLFENGGLDLKIAHLEEDVGFLHVNKQYRARQLRRVKNNPSFVADIRKDLRVIHIPFVRIEHLRVAIAKQEIRGRKNSVAYAPGYGRINYECGSLDYQLEVGKYILGNLSRRDIADELRATSNRQSLPSDDDLASFDEFMKGRPDD